MSDLIINIGDAPLDLSSGETIALTRQAAKVGDFVAVMADGTNEVTVPLTANNRAVLDNANIITTDSELPYRRTEATMIQEGYETITNGYAILKSSSENFSLQVVGGNGGFFDLIRNLNLRDLDLSAFDHFWTNLNAFNARNNTDGYVYAVFEQSEGLGIDSTMRTYGTNLYAVHTARLLPCFHVKTLIGKIFAEQGYSFVTDLVADDIYNRLVVYNGKPSRGTDMDYHKCEIGLTASQTAITTPFNFIYQYWNDPVILSATNLYTSAPNFLSELNGTDKRFMLTDACRITIEFNLTLTFIYSGQLPTIQVGVGTNGGDAYHYSDPIPFTLANPTQTISTSLTFDCSVVNMESWFTPVIFIDEQVIAITVDAGATYEITNIEYISDGPFRAQFPANYFTGLVPVPDMKQGDFLKDLSKVFQWVYDVNELTKVVTARRFDTVVENIPTAIDLSDRIDVRKQKITYGIDGFAQTNSLAYKPDDISDYDAIGYINVDDQTLKAEGKYIEVGQFAATSTRTRFDTVDAPYVPIFDEEAIAGNGVAHRLLLTKRVNFPHNVNFNRAGNTPADYPTDDLTFAYFAQAGNPASLDFPNLVTRFYQTVKAMSFRGKTLECLMNLKISDVVNYNPFTPVYIQQHGSYFYWQKVSNYVKDKLTKCTLIRL